MTPGDPPVYVYRPRIVGAHYRIMVVMEAPVVSCHRLPTPLLLPILPHSRLQLALAGTVGNDLPMGPGWGPVPFAIREYVHWSVSLDLSHSLPSPQGPEESRISAPVSALVHRSEDCSSADSAIKLPSASVGKPARPAGRSAIPDPDGNDCWQHRTSAKGAQSL